MTDTKVHLQLTCIYAGKDSYLQSQLSSHLERLHQEGYLDAVHFMEIEEQAFAERRYTREQREADLYLVLLSPHLLATPFPASTFLKKMLAAHQYERVRIIPVLLADGDYRQTALGKLPRLNANQEALKNETDFSLEANLTIISGELKLEIVDWRDKKQELESRWQETREEDQLRYYENFLKDYPHSIYREQAQKRLDELKEQDLWRTAKAIDNIHHYYLYLRDAPLQHNRVEAIKRIAEIEQDENTARDDALQSESLAMLFDYKTRFPYGASLKEVDDKMNKLAEERVHQLDEPEYIQTEAHYLQHLAYAHLNQDELLSMRLLLDFTHALIRRSRSVVSGIGNTQLSVALVGLFGLIVSVYSVPPLFRFAQEGTFGFRPLLTFAACIAGIYLVVRAYFAFRIATKDIQFCRFTAKALERSLVTIKISSIDHDHRALFQETASLIRIEDIYRRLTNDGLWVYLFERSTKSSLKQEEVLRQVPLPLR